VKRYLLLTAMLIVTMSAHAANLDGKWLAQITNTNGTLAERVFIFQVADGKLSGTIINLSVAQATFEQPGKPIMSGMLKTQQGKPLDITEGQISGEEVSFVVVGNMFGTLVRTMYTGKIHGDEIDFTAETKIPEGLKSPSGSTVNPQPPQQLVAKRIAN